MLSFAALSINRFFTTAPKLERETPGNRTATLRALSDLGESVASSVHAIYAQSRLYLCVAMQPKPEALQRARGWRIKRPPQGISMWMKTGALPRSTRAGASAPC